MPTSTRRAFTLIELLVVIGIVSVLIGLLLPALQKVRGAAQRMECTNHLRQVGLAALQYHDERGAFPSGMYWQKGKSPYRLCSWLTQLLPFVEQGSLWDQTLSAYRTTKNALKNPPHVGLSTVIPVFNCPADGRTSNAQTAQMDKISVALTSYLGVSGSDLRTNDGILFRDSQVRLMDITDGASNTLLAGERPPSKDFQFGWWYAGAGQRFTGSADMILGVAERNILPYSRANCPNGPYQFAPGSFSNQCDMFHFWSPHTGGAHFLFADGSVHFLSYSAAPLLPALASRAGGEAVALPE
jgi:prepilin-type N-terminal cleavage/methylation domain-containing protein/prepilin-type processing-associated H-X9-DG protein